MPRTSWGSLSQYFEAIAVKDLSVVEVEKNRSNQHEFNATAELKRVFGAERRECPTQFVYLSDSDSSGATESGSLTWYDAREKHPTRSEFRLYYTASQILDKAQAGDHLYICLRKDGSVLAVVAKSQSTISSQLSYLFGLQIVALDHFVTLDEGDLSKRQLSYASQQILELIGISASSSLDAQMQEMIEHFDGTLPSTEVFSSYARSTVKHASPIGDPDETLVAWLEREELLFRAFEKSLLLDRVQAGFDDVDDFLKVSNSVRNRRMSRAGLSFENHIDVLLELNGVEFDRGKLTENRAKPDFVFPSIAAYHNPAFSDGLLTMLGAKTTCKDRWRQVLAEAERIPQKHLITIEPAISSNQTSEMKAHNLQLVVPVSIQESYTAHQRKWLISVKEFIELVLHKQNSL
ncbi:MAG: type II restriction endonuclease [Coriobacteriia bacterium]|nr:type II restriction endonuclease [Coriobacteriia bacterium]MCL2537701.1 type II restriction endonuclease [Coriobacteriia bacterium]